MINASATTRGPCLKILNAEECSKVAQNPLRAAKRRRVIPPIGVKESSQCETNEGNVDAERTWPDTRNIMSSNQGLASKAAANPSNPAVDPRRERRIHVAVPVKVFVDANSIDSQTCCTYEISTIGVRLVAPVGIKEPGQIVMVQRHSRRAKYKVVWIGKPNTSEAGQVGLEAMEPHNVIWENEIKARLAQAD